MAMSGTTFKLMAVLAFGVVIVSCASAPQPPSVPKVPHVASAVQLSAGCLLPDPAVFAGVDASKVVLRVKVSPAGKVVSAEIVDSTRNAALDEAFIKAVFNCGFTPAKLDGEPVASSYSLVHRWKAKDGFQGPLRCFLPEYPRGALANERTGFVPVRFRFADLSAEPEVWLPEGWLRLDRTDPSLARAAVEAVRACLANPEARKGLRENASYEIEFTFRFE